MLFDWNHDLLGLILALFDPPYAPREHMSNCMSSRKSLHFPPCSQAWRSIEWCIDVQEGNLYTGKWEFVYQHGAIVERPHRSSIYEICSQVILNNVNWESAEADGKLETDNRWILSNIARAKNVQHDWRQHPVVPYKTSNVKKPVRPFLFPITCLGRGNIFSSRTASIRLMRRRWYELLFHLHLRLHPAHFPSDAQAELDFLFLHWATVAKFSSMARDVSLDGPPEVEISQARMISWAWESLMGHVDRVHVGHCWSCSCLRAPNSALFNLFLDLSH